MSLPSAMIPAREANAFLGSTIAKSSVVGASSASTAVSASRCSWSASRIAVMRLATTSSNRSASSARSQNPTDTSSAVAAHWT